MFTKEEKSVIENFYNDFLKVESIYLEKGKLIKNKDIFELNRQGRKKEVLQIIYITDQLEQLLKFLYIQGTIFIRRVFRIIESKINSNPQKDFKFQLFWSNYGNSLKLSKNLKQQIYCFIIYRNKIIEHHDFDRSPSRTGSKGHEDEIRLSPLPRSFFEGGMDCCYKKIEPLAKKYKYQGDMAINIATTRLFNEVIWDDSDRKDINSLIEEMGCVSLNRPEIKKLLEDFMKEVKNNYY